MHNKKKTMFEYLVWKHDANMPIECVVNVLLLFSRERAVVQMDITYYTLPRIRAIRAFVDALGAAVVVRHDSSGNLILYEASRAHSIETTLRAKDGTIEGGLRSCDFARLLDPSFYVCNLPLERIFKHKNLYRVSIDVCYNGRSGPLLVQMLRPTTAHTHLSKIARRFETLRKRLCEIDPELHLTLTVYTKPGNWKDGVEYATTAMEALPS